MGGFLLSDYFVGKMPPFLTQVPVTFVYDHTYTVLVVKNLLVNGEDIRDEGSILGSGRSPGKGDGNPLLYSCLQNPVDRGARQATVHRVTKSWTWLKWLNMHAYFHKKYVYYRRKLWICTSSHLWLPNRHCAEGFAWTVSLIHTTLCRAVRSCSSLSLQMRNWGSESQEAFLAAHLRKDAVGIHSKPDFRV